MKTLIEQLAERYATAQIVHPILKPVTLAQWLLESGRGSSKLAQDHLNFGGLKWRPEMTGYATKVLYQAHDGQEYYCKFASLDAFIIGYWKFLTRSPYAGWENHASSGKEFIEFIGPIYTPSAGYAGRVLSLVPEAEAMIKAAGTARGKGGVIVIDPGHGGTAKTGGSSPNNATAHPSGILEKTMTLDFALLLRQQILALSPNTAVHLTRTADVNVGLAKRANLARDKKADIFISLHFNGFNKTARGVETLILPQSSNVNFNADQELAKAVQAKVFAATKAIDPATKDRGVKQQSLGVLKDVDLGNTFAQSRTRGCLLEFEFIDHPAVDKLYNTSVGRVANRTSVCRALAEALVSSLP